jgi:hypothetical protein
MRTILKEIIFACEAVYAVAVTIIVGVGLGIIPGSQALLAVYGSLFFAAPVVVTLIVRHWRSKFPGRISWYRLAYGATAIVMWLYAVVVLLRYYQQGIIATILSALLVVPIAPLSFLVGYLCYKAYKNRFER